MNYYLLSKEVTVEENMESIQHQITLLTKKVELIYQAVDRLQSGIGDRQDDGLVGGQVDATDRLSADDLQRLRQSGSKYREELYADLSSNRRTRQVQSELYADRQEISIDINGIETSHQVREQDLAPQFQIQRLTAQLTAAYNRIAALEEQLLAKRWK